MDNITPFATIIAGVVCWGLAQFTNRYQLYISDRKILKETLYFLLELYHQVSAQNEIEKVTEQYIQHSESKYPEELIKNIDSYMENLIAAQNNLS